MIYSSSKPHGSNNRVNTSSGSTNSYFIDLLLKKKTLVTESNYFAGESEPVLELVLFPDSVGPESELFVVLGEILS